LVVATTVVVVAVAAVAPTAAVVVAAAVEAATVEAAVAAVVEAATVEAAVAAEAITSIQFLEFASKMPSHPERVPACRDESKDLHFRAFDVCTNF
jgi:hypothetical protein